MYTWIFMWILFRIYLGAAILTVILRFFGRKKLFPTLNMKKLIISALLSAPTFIAVGIFTLLGTKLNWPAATGYIVYFLARCTMSISVVLIAIYWYRD